MKKTLVVNGEYFEIVKAYRDFEPTHLYFTLDDCYTSYSVRKKNAFNYWRNWFSELNDSIFNGVISHNCNFFTVGGYLFNAHTEYGDFDIHFHITHAHNYAYFSENDYEKIKQLPRDIKEITVW